MRTLKLLSMLCLLWTVGIVANADEIPNDEIWYEASEKLTETTGTNYYDYGLHINAFNTSIPSHTFINGKGIIKFNGNVTSIGYQAFRRCSGLTSITIPNSVMSIGNEAFSSCSGLTSITIPNSVTSIGERAFESCSGLTSITIPNSVTSIGNYAFSSCSGLTSITIPNSVTSIEKRAFEYCSGLTSITIPNSVTSIGNYAFANCSGLTSITIPNSVKSMGANPFLYCSGLETITVSKDNPYFSDYGSNIIVNDSTHGLITGCNNSTIPNSVTSIGDDAFADCSGLTSITIPNSVTSIGGGVFSGCSGLTSITIPNSVTSIGEHAFYYCSRLTSVTIPNSVTSIGNWAFNYCSCLKSVTIGNSVKSIGENAFSNCNNFRELIYSYGATRAFNLGLTGLTSVTLPKTITTIDASAFSECYNLQTLDIPKSVTSIGAYAFQNMSKLKTMYVHWDEPITVAANILDGASTSSATLYVPSSAVDAYKAAPVWKDFGTITIRSEEPYNFFAIDKNGSEIKEEVKSDDDVEIQDSYVDLLITENVEDVNITYTRSFSSSGNWQAWFVPFDVNYNDMSKDYEVAQIQGVLTDENGSPYIAFCKVKSGVIKANTPYVVKPKLSGEIQTKTTSKLHTTDDAKPFTIQSVANTFTFGGVYEKTTIGNKGWYALNTKGSFQKMGESLYLKSFRLYMSIAERADNPYSASVASDEVKMIVLGDEDATSINEVESLISTGKMYTLQGLETNVIRRGEIYIINGKKYLGK